MDMDILVVEISDQFAKEYKASFQFKQNNCRF